MSEPAIYQLVNNQDSQSYDGLNCPWCKRTLVVNQAELSSWGWHPEQAERLCRIVHLCDHALQACPRFHLKADYLVEVFVGDFVESPDLHQEPWTDAAILSCEMLFEYLLPSLGSMSHLAEQIFERGSAEISPAQIYVSGAADDEAADSVLEWMFERYPEALTEYYR